MIKLSSVTLALLCLAAAGCATQPVTRKDSRDPFERVNRVTYAFNDALDRAIAKPVAKTYRKVVPHFVQTGVSNLMSNAGYPTVIVNDVLQAKFKPALLDTGRFVLNTTLGLGGLLDPASAAGLQRNDEDFGQTLGKWGVPPGPYLVLPLLGFSDVRDAIGLVPDEYTDPRHYIDSNTVRWSVRVLALVDQRARLLDAESALQNVFDRYAFTRNAYLQRRNYLVHDGNVPDEPVDEELLEEDSGDSPAGQSAPPQGKAGEPPDDKASAPPHPAPPEPAPH